MIFSKIAGDISEIAGDLAISEQSVKKIIIPAYLGKSKNILNLVSKIFGDPRSPLPYLLVGQPGP